MAGSHGKHIYECPECGVTIINDLGGGGTANFRGAFCTGTDEEPHTATPMERNDG